MLLFKYFALAQKLIFISEVIFFNYTYFISSDFRALNINKVVKLFT